MAERDHEVHVPNVQTEEQRNDFIDTSVGFFGMFGFLFLLATIMTIITIIW